MVNHLGKFLYTLRQPCPESSINHRRAISSRFRGGHVGRPFAEHLHCSLKTFNIHSFTSDPRYSLVRYCFFFFFSCFLFIHSVVSRPVWLFQSCLLAWTKRCSQASGLVASLNFNFLYHYPFYNSQHSLHNSPTAIAVAPLVSR